METGLPLLCSDNTNHLVSQLRHHYNGCRKSFSATVVQFFTTHARHFKNGLLSGIVEMDETYVGGKPRKEAKKKNDNDDDGKGNPRGRATKKECIVGMIERGEKVKSCNLDDSLQNIVPSVLML